MNRITIDEVAAAVRGTVLHRGEKEYIDGVKQDSRECADGDLFVAIKGENLDGHNYVAKAVENGCSAVMISDESCAADNSLKGSASIIKVEDTVRALGDLAAYYLETLNVIKIAVTGSVGKTSVRDMIYYVASEKYNCGRNIKNYNNLIGLPLSIFLFDSDTEVVVLEMGMDRFGEIDRMAEIVRPDIGVITNIGMSHIENLGSRQGIFQAKMEITKHIGNSRDTEATLIFAEDGEFLTKENTAGNYSQISVGKDRKSDYIISSVDDFGIEGIQFTLEHNDEKRRIKVPVPGMHNAVNGSIAVAAGNLMGITMEEAERGLGKVQLTGSRLRLVQGEKIRIIDDTYNASPDSVKSALRVLAASRCSGRRVAVLGDMYELGDEAQKQHFGVGEFAAHQDIDILVAIGENAYEIAKGASGSSLKVIYHEEKKEFIEELTHVINAGDLILVKGSRGMKMEQIVEELLNF
ncbi:MAG: UDP-N-acetylmuramoyl-tripeptide--D-alanyl-D-alanine ligase [Lentihominibacter sp.]